MARDEPDVTELAERANRLRELHHGSHPLVLANAWDAASARAVEAAGFAAVATSSSAVAASLGFEDTDSMPPDEAFSAVRRVSSVVTVPVTADIEAGYQLDADDIATRLLSAGAVGCNFEDTDNHHGDQLVPVETQVGRIADLKAAAKASGVDVVVNARVDVFRFNDDHASALGAAIERAQQYRAAGADCVYPIRLADVGLIDEFVRAVASPVNILVTEPAQIARLAEVGVRRVSFAGGLFRTTQAAMTERLRAIAQSLVD